MLVLLKAIENIRKKQFSSLRKKLQQLVWKKLFFTQNSKNSGNTYLRNLLLPCGLKPQNYTKYQRCVFHHTYGNLLKSGRVFNLEEKE